MFPPLDIPFEYWIEHVTFGLLYTMFRLSTKISDGGFPGFLMIVLVVFWCGGFTTYLMYVGPRFGNLV